MSQGREQELVVSALDSAVEEIRHQACKRLPEVFEQLPVEHLLRALGDTSWRVRKCAASILTAAPVSPELLSSLAVAIGAGDNAGLRNAATEVLIQLGPPAVPAVVELLRQGDQDERKFAADILGEIGDAAALEPLLEKLADADENVRAAAAEALGRCNLVSATPQVLERLRSDGLLVQLSCLDALGRLGASVRLAELDQLLKVKPLRPQIFRLLGSQVESEVLPVLLDGLQARGRAERTAAVLALVQRFALLDRPGQVETRVAVSRAAGDEVCEHLREVLASPGADERQAAATMLGWIGRPEFTLDLIRASREPMLRETVHDALLAVGPRAAGELAEALDDIGRLEKVLALELLGHFRRPEHLGLVIERCLSEDAEVSEAAQRALGVMGGPQVIPTLVELLGRRSGEAVSGAVASLVMLGERFHDEVVAAVMPLLGVEPGAMRAAAAEVFCSIARRSDLEQVCQLIGDRDTTVRACAVTTLGRIGDAPTVERLRMALTDESTEVRAATARALGLRGDDESRKALAVALRDSDPWVVREAICGLGEGGAGGATEALLPLVDHADGAVALAAVRALNRIGWGGDEKRLRQACRHADVEVVKEAIGGVREFSLDIMRSILVEALADLHWDVRMAAVKRMGALRDPLGLQEMAKVLHGEKDDLVREAMTRLLRLEDAG